jgi:choline dehydrogenase
MDTPAGIANAAIIYNWLMTSAVLQSNFLADNVFNRETNSEYDFIIVGGGTAGCVMASRLSEIPEFRVLLIEKGGSGNDFIDINLFMHDADSDAFEESIYTTTQKHAWLQNGGVAHYKIGHSLGGGSTHNTMNYVLGTPVDYDGWEKLGAKGWSFSDVLPYFKKMETDHPDPDTVYNASLRGFRGPVHSQPAHTNAFGREKFLQAACELGFNISDYNSFYDSFDASQLSSFNGVRSSTRRAYLLPALNRPNLQVICHSMVTRSFLDGNRAVGVEYERSGSKHVVRAKKEVIVSASALISPQLLMVSGVGPAATLQQYGIPLVKDLPGVGRNLQDHTAHRIICPLSRNVYSKFLDYNDIQDYDNNKTGPIAISGFIGIGQFKNYESKSDHDVRYQIPMFFVNIATLLGHYSHFTPFGKRRLASIIDDTGSVTLNTVAFENLLLAPYSRGAVSIQSNSMADKPVVDGGILTDERDRKAAADLLRIAHNFATSDAMKELGVIFTYMDFTFNCALHVPDSDDYYLCLAQQYTYTAWHYCGTAKMGSVSDPMAVVDSELKVIGVKGLRVIDASVMPTIPRGNINMPIVMVAEKASDMIKKEYGKSTKIVYLERFDDVKLLNQSIPTAPLIQIP